MAQSPTRANLIGSPPDFAGRRTTDGGAGDAAIFVDGSSDATGTTRGARRGGPCNSSDLGGEHGARGLSNDRSAVYGPISADRATAAAFADLVLPCDAFFSLHGQESSVGVAWTFRLPEVSQATEDLAVSAAVLAVLFCGVPNERIVQDDKQNRLALQV